jgi:hypothetical protein
VNDSAPAHAASRPRWQFSLRALFALTAIVAGLLALVLAGLWIFVVDIILVTVLGAAFFIGTRRSLRKPTPPNITGIIRLLAIVGLACTASSLWLHENAVINALLPLAGAVAAIGGYLAAVDASGRLPDTPLAKSWRYVFSAAGAVLLAGWGTLHAFEKWYDQQAQRHVRRIEERGLFSSWGKDTSRMIGPVPLFRYWTIDVHDWDRRATDADLEAIAAADLVNSLDLAGSQITDAGLAHLKSLTNLQSLDVRGTKVTAHALDELREALPNLTDVKY